MSKPAYPHFLLALQRWLHPTLQPLQAQWRQMQAGQRQRVVLLSLCIPLLLLIYGIQHQWQQRHALRQQYSEAQAELEQLQQLISQAQSSHAPTVALASAEQAQALINSLPASLKEHVILVEQQPATSGIALDFKQAPALELSRWLLHTPPTIQLQAHTLTLQRHRGELGPQAGVINGSALLLPNDADTTKQVNQ
ncbi:type II secretion system protein GspM [Alcaligenes endophyticus]|uniref:Type II secretion system protein GspM n=1 Tax=Alcaligenes endophyticus TaxID=1929088 RepID=A0ABT8EGJ3_9BURK|nr:type II secretion system protein GspM [Alcaligenes endophyticus]MCX5589923.1 type II secretion system protein GspM [Alcaligenes endophyticus]MDN4120414.1 type II secretion system protein GspM [Alcaligenes endophyticus]